MQKLTKTEQDLAATQQNIATTKLDAQQEMHNFKK